MVVAGVLVATAGPSVADQEPERESVSPEDVAFGRFEARCSTVELEFTGELYAKRPGRPPEPLTNAKFQCTGQWQASEPCEAEILPDGSFRALAIGCDRTYVTTKPNGQEKVKRSFERGRVTIRAPGCREKRLTVDREWRDRRIVLKCKKP
jgi:hypothetical protein